MMSIQMEDDKAQQSRQCQKKQMLSHAQKQIQAQVNEKKQIRQQQQQFLQQPAFFSNFNYQQQYLADCLIAQEQDMSNIQKINEDIKEIKGEINNLNTKITQGLNNMDKNMIQGLNDMDKKMIQGFNDLEKKMDKNMIQGLNDMDKKMIQGFNDLEKKMDKKINEGLNEIKKTKGFMEMLGQNLPVLLVIIAISILVKVVNISIQKEDICQKQLLEIFKDWIFSISLFALIGTVFVAIIKYYLQQKIQEFKVYACFLALILIIVGTIYMPQLYSLSILQSSHICQYFIELRNFQIENIGNEYVINTKVIKRIRKSIKSYINSQPQQKILLIQGYPGVGKSTALRNFISFQQYTKIIPLYFNYHGIRKQQINKFMPFYKPQDSQFEPIEQIDIHISELKFKKSNFKLMFQKFLREIKQKGKILVFILDQVDDLYLSEPFKNFTDFLFSCIKKYSPNFVVVIVSTQPKLQNLESDKYQRIYIKKNNLTQIIKFLKKIYPTRWKNAKDKQKYIKKIASNSNSLRQARSVIKKCAVKTNKTKCFQKLISQTQKNIKLIIRNIEQKEIEWLLKKQVSKLNKNTTEILIQKNLINKNNEWSSKIVQKAIKKFNDLLVRHKLLGKKAKK